MLSRRSLILSGLAILAPTSGSYADGGTTWVEEYGYRGDGIADESDAVQRAIDDRSRQGGGVVQIPGGICLFEWPVFIPSGVTVVHEGTTVLITHGVGGRPVAPAYVLGDCREFSRRIVEYNKSRGDHRTKFEDDQFRDIPLGAWPEEDDRNHGLHGIDSARIRVVNAGVSGMHIQPTGPLTDRSYGVFFGNASRCFARNWSSDGLTQPFSIGSDVHPRTPYAVDCVVSDLTVYSPSPYNTYYGIGFLGNANRCHVRKVRQLAGVPNDLRNGNMLYANYSRECILEDFHGVCGKGRNGDGVGLQNSSACVVRNGKVIGARQGISEFFRDLNFLSKERPNVFENIMSVDCDTMLRVGSRYSQFRGIRSQGCQVDIMINSLSAFGNTFFECDMRSIKGPHGVPVKLLVAMNSGLSLGSAHD